MKFIMGILFGFCVGFFAVPIGGQSIITLNSTTTRGAVMVCGQRLDEILELALSYIDDPAKSSYRLMNSDLVLHSLSQIERTEEDLKALKKKADAVEKIRKALECVKK